MLVQSVLLLSGAVITAGLGIPVAARLARPHHWKRFAPLDRQRKRAMEHSGPAFQPLDLGPDPIRWPSEVERPFVGPAEPPWPSQTWDDEHFGAFWRRAEAKRVVDEVYVGPRPGAERPPQVAERSETTELRPRPAPPQAPTPQRAARAEMEFFTDTAQRVAQQASDFMEDPVGAVREAASAGGAAPPSAEELRRMVGQLGLAGTVQAIMQQTGWDFRQSAHYLARVRQQR